MCVCVSLLVCEWDLPGLVSALYNSVCVLYCCLIECDCVCVGKFMSALCVLCLQLGIPSVGRGNSVVCVCLCVNIQVCAVVLEAWKPECLDHSVVNGHCVCVYFETCTQASIFIYSGLQANQAMYPTLSAFQV